MMNQLIQVAQRGDVEEFSRILSHHPNSMDVLNRRDNDGWTITHHAANGNSTEIVSLILEKGGDPLSEIPRGRNTPLHLALMSKEENSKAIADMLYKKAFELKVAPRTNKEGTHPLHLAAKLGYNALAKSLLKQCPEAKSAANAGGMTPLGMALSGGHKEIVDDIIEVTDGSPTQFEDFQTIFPSYNVKAQRSLTPPVKIFVVGDNSSGKSTLIKSIQGESFYYRFRGIAYSTTNVPTNRVGLVPRDFLSKNCGRVIFYDLASGANTVHEDLMEDLNHSLFIVVVDNRPEKTVMEQRLEFWLSFVLTQFPTQPIIQNTVAQQPQSRPNVLIIASFGELHNKKAFRHAPAIRLNLVVRSISRHNRELCRRLNIVNSIALDCRKAESPPMRILRDELSKMCRELRPPTTPLHCQCYILSETLRQLEVDIDSKNDQLPVVKLGNLASLVQKKSSETEPNLYHLLPQDSEELHQLCLALEKIGQVILIPSSQAIESTWIVYGRAKVADKLDELFVNKQQESKGSIALMSSEVLEECLQPVASYGMDLLTQLLECFRIHDNSVRNIMNLPSEPPYFFFPALLSLTGHTGVEVKWDTDGNCTCFAWSIVPSSKDHQLNHVFLPRFTKTLLVLLYHHSKQEFEHCCIWSEGLHFQDKESDNLRQLEVTIIANSKAVILNMRFESSIKIPMLQLRNRILNEIRSHKERIQPETAIEETLVLNDGKIIFPVRSPPLPRYQEEVGEPDPWEPGTNYSFAWCVVPCPQDDNIIEFFLPQFLKKLLLCFIESFLIHHADKQSQQEQVDISSAVVWSRGVSWSTIDDTKVHIELNDNAIILSMYSLEGKELNCLQIRNKLLATIKDEKKKWQPDITIKESIIPFGDKFPVQLKNFDNHRKIPLQLIEKAILKGKLKVDDVDLQKLLFYEPCIAVSRLTKPLQDVICDPDQATEFSQENMSELVDELGKEFLQHFNLSDHQSDGTPQPHTSSTQSVTTESEEEAPTILQDPDSQMISSITCTSPLTIPSAMSHDTSEWNLSSRKLVECMNSVSIMDTVEFLQQLEKHLPSSPPSETSSLVRGGIQLKDSTLKHSQQLSIFTLSDSDLPFIETPTVLQCGSEQQVYNFKKYGIKLVFPPRAVTRGTLDVEIGILHSGPFTLPPNVKPISPVLWLCVKEKVKPCHEFSKRIEITLPHFMDCTPEDQKKFAFLKSTHNHSISDNSFTFKEASVDHCRFQPRNGTLTTKQCCLVCIAYKEPEGMIDKSNYCLVSFIPRDIAQSMFAMYFCVIFNLKSFIEVLRTQFPGYEIYAKKEFKFAKGSTEQQQHVITIHFSTHLPHGWIVANSGFENNIAASEVDFYDSNTFGYLHFLEEEDTYPPRFAIEVNGSSATKTDILCVSFKGATKELKIEKSLTVLHKQLSGSVSLDRVFTDAQDPTKQQSPSGSLLQSRHSSTPSLSAAANILERNLDILIKYLNVDLIRPALRKHGVLLPDEADKLIDFSNHSGITRGSVIEKLITMLSSKGSSGIYYFKKALEETTEAMGHQDILKELSMDPEFEAIVNDPSYAGN